MTHNLQYRRMLSKMGYYSYQAGLVNNHLKQEGGWDSHLAKCRDIIIKAIDFHKPEKITVLGSGWLLDLPLAEMIEKVSEIILVDIVHPPGVITQTEHLKNITVIEADVTGGLIEEVFLKAGKYYFFRKMSSLENINIPIYEPDFEPGMIISLNLLTQLESLIIDYIKKRSRIQEAEFIKFRAEIQKKHIEFLSKRRAVLISDYSEIFTNRSGDIKTVPTLFTEIPSGYFKEEWTWDFDLKGTEYYTRKSVMKIISVIM